MNPNPKQIASVLRAAGNPLRVKILLLLKEKGALPVGDIEAKIKVSQALTSHHLILLKKAGFIKSERAGKNVLYSMDSEKLYSLLETTIAYLQKD